MATMILRNWISHKKPLQKKNENPVQSAKTRNAEQANEKILTDGDSKKERGSRSLLSFHNGSNLSRMASLRRKRRQEEQDPIVNMIIWEDHSWPGHDGFEESLGSIEYTSTILARRMLPG